MGGACVCGAVPPDNADIQAEEADQEKFLDNKEKQTIAITAEDDIASQPHASAAMPKKIVFFGTGDSGKTTIFQNLKMLYFPKFFNTMVADNTKENIHSFVIDNMQELLRTAITENVNLSGINESVNRIRRITVCSGDNIDKSDLASHIAKVWHHNSIQRIVRDSVLSSTEDSLRYFIDDNRIDRVMSDSFAPTKLDLLKVRRSTTGIIETVLTINSINCHIFDTGGQRAERRKWAHIGKNIDCIVFVIDLSCFDQSLYEDENTNAMVEQYSVFGTIMNETPAFEGESTMYALIFNKVDLFRFKIEKQNKSIKNCFLFSEYNNDSDSTQQSFDDALAFVKEKFLKSIVERNNTILTYECNAIESDNIRLIFEDVTHSFLLPSAG